MDHDNNNSDPGNDDKNELSRCVFSFYFTLLDLRLTRHRPRWWRQWRWIQQQQHASKCSLFFFPIRASFWLTDTSMNPSPTAWPWLTELHVMSMDIIIIEGCVDSWRFVIHVMGFFFNLTFFSKECVCILIFYAMVMLNVSRKLLVRWTSNNPIGIRLLHNVSGYVKPGPWLHSWGGAGKLWCIFYNQNYLPWLPCTEEENWCYQQRVMNRNCSKSKLRLTPP